MTASTDAASASGSAGSPLPPRWGSRASEVASDVATVSFSGALTGSSRVVQAAGRARWSRGRAGAGQPPGGPRRSAALAFAAVGRAGRRAAAGRPGPGPAAAAGRSAVDRAAGESSAGVAPAASEASVGGTSAGAPSALTVEVGAAAAGRPGFGRTGLAPGLGASDFGSIWGLSAAAFASAAGDPGGGSFLRM